MKRKLWLQRLSISAPTMTVKSQLPLPLRVVFGLLLLAVGIAAALWVYDLGRGFAGFDSDTRDQRTQLIELREERDKLIKSVDAAESRLNIERAAQNQLSEQIKTLETENVRLKEDLAFFESLLPANTGPQGLTIQRMSVEPVPPNQLRFRLLVMQGGNGKQRFGGELQLVVTAEQGGQTVTLTYPKERSADQDSYKLGFKHYQRLEGVIALPEGAVVKNVQARVLEKGQIKVQKSTGL
ncbi:MAG: DUF6776 family protein [Burkholderiaceae bacterium]|nr:DUF6776 family protein [Burkholderiaceae bacterium]